MSWTFYLSAFLGGAGLIHAVHVVLGRALRGAADPDPEPEPDVDVIWDLGRAAAGGLDLRALPAPDRAGSFRPPSATPIPVFDPLGGPPSGGFDLAPEQAAAEVHPRVDRKPHRCEPRPLGPVPATMLPMLCQALDAIWQADRHNWIAEQLLDWLRSPAWARGSGAEEDAADLANRLQASVESAWAAFAAAHTAHAATTGQLTGQFPAVRAADATAVQLAEVR